jgi:hypothetical protein
VDVYLPGSVNTFQTTNSMINTHWTNLTLYGLPK